jgi:hypothetical protein
MQPRRRFATAAACVTTALLLAACGGDDDQKFPTAFVGEIPRSQFYIGISLPKGKEVVAYVCDGKSTGEWFRGERHDTEVDLKSASGARLQASLSEATATGNVTIARNTLEFQAPPAFGEAGLYRRESARRGRKTVSGWVLLADGRKKGVTTTTQEKLATQDGDLAPAPNQTATPVAEQNLPQPPGRPPLGNTFLGDHPAKANPGWHENGQGIADDDRSYWFITRKSVMYKIPVGFDLKFGVGLALANGQPGLDAETIPEELRKLGYDHFGDPDYIARLDRQYLFVPITGEGGAAKGHPVIAAFDATNLDYIDHEAVNQTGAGWVAIDPTNELLYSANGRISGSVSDGAGPMFRYKLNISTLKSTKVLNLELKDRAVVLKSRGVVQVLDHIQGGVFSPRGYLYLVTGFYDHRYDHDGVSVYDVVHAAENGVSPGNLITHSCNGGPCKFNYQWNPGLREDPWEDEGGEPEGLTWWNRDVAPTSPGVRGDLHIMMVDNDWLSADEVYMKHYNVTGG